MSKNPSSFIEAKVAVAARIATGQPAPMAPKVLPWSQVETIPDLFQQRYPDEASTQQHIQTLAQAIKRGPRGAHQADLAPITVFWVGDAWTCVDGHHRLMAYRWVNHPNAVPVRVLKGATLDEAIRESLGRNSGDKLPLSKRCKTEAAWRFEMAGGMSKAAIAALAGVDATTVANMRRTRAEFSSAHPQSAPGDLTWHQMRTWKRPRADGERTDPEQKAAEQLYRAIERASKEATPGVWCRCLEMMQPGLVVKVAQRYEDLKHSARFAPDPFPYTPSDTEVNPDF